MEAVAGPRAGEPAALAALDGGQRGLGVDRAVVEHRVGVLDAAEGLVGRRLGEGVQRHHHRGLERQGLQAVDEVAHRHRARVGRALAGEVVPRRPHLLPARQQGGVGVQVRDVGLVLHRAEDAALFRRGLAAEDGEGLVAVAGEDEFVEALRPARGMHPHPVLAAHHALHRRIHPHVVETGEHAAHVAAPATLHRHPGRTVEDLQQAVVVAEVHEGRERVGQHGARRAGPDRCGHGQQVPVAEGLRVALEVEVLAERQGRHGALVRHARSLAVEAQDVAQHAEEGGAHQI